jgi:exodeoxyribonuclease VII large subunit
LQRLQERLASLHPRARLLANKNALSNLERRLAAANPGGRIARARRELDNLVARRDSTILRLLQARRASLGQIGAQIAALSPLAVLDRGYAMVSKDREIIRDAAQVVPGDRLHVRLAKGEIDVEVIE